MFYRRLVKGTYSRKYKYALWFGMFLALVATVVPTAYLLTSCHPFEVNWMQWDLTYVYKNAYQFHCRNVWTIVSLANMTGCLSVITDFYAVLLPTVLLMRMKINKRQKYGLMVVFGVGLLYVLKHVGLRLSLTNLVL